MTVVWISTAFGMTRSSPSRVRATLARIPISSTRTTLPSTLQEIAQLDTALDEKDDAGHEVLRDALHREAKADGEERASRE